MRAIRSTTSIIVAGIGVLMFAAGCYAPDVPSGGFRCDESDGQCPSGMECRCGTCVGSEEEAACSFKVEILTAACVEGQFRIADGCVKEGEPFPVRVTAFASEAGVSPPVKSKYRGTATIESTWGHATVASKYQFNDGVAEIQVALDRATPHNGTAAVVARVGERRGISTQSVIVDPQPFEIEPEPVIDLKGAKWAAGGFVGNPTVDHGGGQHRLYFNGARTLLDQSEIGLATSTDGVAWDVASGPVLSPPKGMGNAAEHYRSPSVLRRNGEVHLFFGSVSGMSKGFRLMRARSGDGLAWTGTPEVVLDHSGCWFCSAELGVGFPTVIPEPTDPGAQLLYFNTSPAMGSGVTSNLGIGRSRDATAWMVSPVPTISDGKLVAGLVPVKAQLSPRVLFDQRTGIYRMWYAEAEIIGILPLVEICQTTIKYATSVDGTFWTGARKDAAIVLANVPWAASRNPHQKNLPVTGVFPAFIEPPTDKEPRFTLWYSPVTAWSACVPVGIGRAYRK